MKVGTDGVLLGAWAPVAPATGRILDIGTGTGLIALMMAQRTAPPRGADDGAVAPTERGGARITGVDVEDLSDARENAQASPWSTRIDFVRTPVQEFAPGCRYDLIVSNPPFFVDSLLCPDRARTQARHAVSLPFEELRDAVARLLAPGGRFAVVLPVEEGARFEACCRGVLEGVRRTRVRTTPRKPPRRVLMEFALAGEAPRGWIEDELLIGTGAHEEYTPEYRALTGDFYLKF